MNRSLIYFDEEDFQNSIDLLEAVNQIYKDSEYETYAICFNHNEVVIDGKFDYIISIQNQEIKNYDVPNITNCIEELHHIYDFDSILIPATYLGRMLAPRLSMRLKVGLVADVTAIEHNNGQVEMIRPAFSGKIFAGIVNKNCKTIMMSVRPNVFVYATDSIKKTKKINFEPTNVEPSKIRLLTTIEKENVKDIRESEVLVSGGGGVIGDFEHLYLLAQELNGMVSASRSLVDSGIADRKSVV